MVISETTAWITQLCETSAMVTFEGELWEWEDVRLLLLDAQGQEIPERLYGKVTAVKPDEGNRGEAQIRFTSVSPEIYPFFPGHRPGLEFKHYNAHSKGFFRKNDDYDKSTNTLMKKSMRLLSLSS